MSEFNKRITQIFLLSIIILLAYLVVEELYIFLPGYWAPLRCISLAGLIIFNSSITANGRKEGRRVFLFYTIYS
ncbi:MAG: hypothetical protein WDO71_12515 [Bacteroidota bacterium]